MALLFKNGEANIDLHETYPKQTFRNRFHIDSPRGVLSLSIPVKKPNGNKTRSSEIILDYSQNWAAVHWKSIKSVYESSPFFLYYQDEIEVLFKKKYSTLYEMNEEIILELASLMGFDAKINHCDDFILPNTQSNDYRFLITPKQISTFNLQHYNQVFEQSNGFLENLSTLDLLFNLGPEAILYLENITLKTQ